jgi:hypothetical protein
MAIKTQTRDQAEFVLASLHDGVEQQRFALDDLAMAFKNASGQPELRKRHGWLHRHTIDAPLLKESTNLIEPGEAVVVIKGDGDMVDAVGLRVRTITDGEMKTYELGPNGANEVTGTGGSLELVDAEGLLREAADPLPVQETLMVKMPFS